MEEEAGRPPSKKEEGKDEKQKCKFYLSDQGCRPGKSCNWSDDLKDERRSWNCGSPEHMSPACDLRRRVKASLQKPGVEGEEATTMTAREDEAKEDAHPSCVRPGFNTWVQH